MINKRIIAVAVLVIYIILIFIAFQSCFHAKDKPVNKLTESIVENRSQVHLGDFSSLLNYLIPMHDLLKTMIADSSDISILIDKSDYILSLYSDTLLIKQYPVVLGGNPVDDKLYSGDGCTPEGNFKILAKYPHKEWSRFLMIDYPNMESLAKHSNAKAKGIIPPESTPGGEIGIHGVYQEMDVIINIGQNWTAGCISLKNRDIQELYEYVKVGAKVVIRK